MENVAVAVALLMVAKEAAVNIEPSPKGESIENASIVNLVLVYHGWTNVPPLESIRI